MNDATIPPPRPLRLGEFLVAAGYITPAQLLDALIHQGRERRSELEILRHNAGLDAHSCLALVDAADQHGASLFHQAVADQVVPGWTLESLQQAQRTSQPPLGRALVQLGQASPAQLRAWLFAFMGQAEPPPASTRIVRQTPMPVPEQQLQPVVSVHANTTTAEPGHHAVLPPTAPLDVDASTLEDYREFLTDDLRTRLDARILSMRDGQGEALVAELDALYRDLHSIKGSANFLGATATVATVHLLEDCLGLVKQRTAALHAEYRQELIDSFLTGLDLVWELRAAVLQDRDEGPRLARIADRHLAFQSALLATAGRLAGQAHAASGPLADMF